MGINDVLGDLSMSNANVLHELSMRIKSFCEARDWDQYHGPKDLAIGLVTESSELLELTRFRSDAELKKQLNDSRVREQFSDELADVLFFLLRFAERNNFDLEKALLLKLEKNNRKYPIATAKGSNKKYTEFND